MGDDTPTHSEVQSALQTGLDSVEVEQSDLAGGTRAVVSDDDVGVAYGIMRTGGYTFDSKRDPSGENVVFNIKSRDSGGLRDLFRDE